MIRLAALAALSLAALRPSVALAFPPEPPMPRILPEEAGKDDWYVELRPEYRARMIRIDPLEVNGVIAKDISWGEHRLRLDASIGRRGLGAVHMQIDALDGVLWGDNGEFGRSPAPTTGVGISSRQGNLAGWHVGLLPGADPLQIDSYGPLLREMTPVNINYLYGEVLLPFGVVRVGRQPVAEVGTAVLNDGRTGRNLWGASWYHESADRVLFGTKLSELFGLIAEGAHYKIDKSLDNGVFLGLVWDWLVNDDVALAADDLHAFSTQLDLRWKDPSSVLGAAWGPIRLTATAAYRWDERFNTSIFALPIRLSFSVGDFAFMGEFSDIMGSTREISSGFAALKGTPATDQRLDLISARAAAEYKFLDQLTVRLEWGYASGDPDPRATTPLTIATWARDTNLGLLLFEHTVAFQTARSAAVGIENLKKIKASSFPFTEIASDGRVIDVNAIFPQVFWDPIPSLRLKAGVLFAFAATDVIDPIQSLLRLDGDRLGDDAINYNGGRPGNYWGTELDLGIEWRYRQFFDAVVEFGFLFPGNALHDENGDAVNSWMIETRFTFYP